MNPLLVGSSSPNLLQHPYLQIPSRETSGFSTPTGDVSLQCGGLVALVILDGLSCCDDGFCLVSCSHSGPSVWPWLLQSSFVLQDVVRSYEEETVAV